jgi:hypothetical protein
MAPNAAYCTPFDRRFVTIDHATSGGQLAVESRFGDAFTVRDTGAATFGSLYIYSFGRPPFYIVPGKRVRSFSGNISKFVGFTEVNFPLFDIPEDPPMPQILPAPTLLAAADTSNLAKLLGLAASTVKASGAVCDVTAPAAAEQWIKYSTFVLDGGSAACDAFTSFSVQLPAKVVGGFDPTMSAGKKATIVGMLKNSSGQNAVVDALGNPVPCDAMNACASGTCVGSVCKKSPYNFWTIVVRDGSDISLQ